ncbi:MAG: tetratricopeptide repeat protein [Myxococcales bacterium]|nr:tetratricopeptide repeat protein [Myxococcales bacterium]
MSSTSRLLALSLAAALAAGCAGRPHRPTTPPAAAPLPEAELSSALHRYLGLALEDPARAALRARLVASIAQTSSAAIEAKDYDAVVDHIARITDLLTPSDFASGHLPRALEPLACFLLREGDRRGDEGRVLAALLILEVLHPEDQSYPRRYRELATWGREARSTIANPLERYGQLLDVWETHADLTPREDVLDTLARLHVERRDAVLAALGPRAESGGGARIAARIEGVTPIDVAAVYLQRGELGEAIAHVEGIADGGETAARLLFLLRGARGRSDAAAGALFDIAQGFRGPRPEVSEGVCRLGLRRFPRDPRFPICLARVAAADERYPDATEWYSQAIALSPGELESYDEALDALRQFIARGLFDTDATRGRALVTQARHILAERQARFPAAPESPLSDGQLDALEGAIDMNAGEPAKARRWFETAVRDQPNPAVLEQLGILLERLGEPAKAAARYREMLDQLPAGSPRTWVARAEGLEHLGDALEAAGDHAQARGAYREALASWDAHRAAARGKGLASLELHRGRLLDQLGKHDEAVAAFHASIVAAPRWRETYSGVLSYLVVRTPPDLVLATDVFRRALLGATLKPEWKVYFALWVQLIAARADRPTPPEVRSLLERMAGSSAWWGHLASLGAGALSYDAVRAHASDRGERTEADFYDGAAKLRAGDVTGARARFEAVLASGMVGFYEYIMAQALLPQLRPAATAASPPPPGAAPPARCPSCPAATEGRR